MLSKCCTIWDAVLGFIWGPQLLILCLSYFPWNSQGWTITSQCTLDLMLHVLRLDWETEFGKGNCLKSNKNVFAWSLTRNQTEKILRPTFLVLWSQQIIQTPLGLIQFVPWWATLGSAGYGHHPDRLNPIFTVITMLVLALSVCEGL